MMIAMHYSFTLPADYDMSIIDQRIAEKGPLLDNLPRLRLKAYMTARRQSEALASDENLYAPFYVWEEAEGLTDFVCGPPFKGLTQAFGRPSVRTWFVWHSSMKNEVAEARFAVRDIEPIAEHSDLESLRTSACDIAAQTLADDDALASVVGFEPTTWSRVNFKLLREAPHLADKPGRQVYSVGHISRPA